MLSKFRNYANEYTYYSSNYYYYFYYCIKKLHRCISEGFSHRQMEYSIL